MIFQLLVLRRSLFRAAIYDNNGESHRICWWNFGENLAEGVGFEPTVELPLRLISSQVPLTTQPPFHSFIYNNLQML